MLHWVGHWGLLLLNILQAYHQFCNKSQKAFLMYSTLCLDNCLEIGLGRGALQQLKAVRYWHLPAGERQVQGQWCFFLQQAIADPVVLLWNNAFSRPNCVLAACDTVISWLVSKIKKNELA